MDIRWQALGHSHANGRLVVFFFRSTVVRRGHLLSADFLQPAVVPYAAFKPLKPFVHFITESIRDASWAPVKIQTAKFE